jgi:simple sugar transport system ATP-binding protein
VTKAIVARGMTKICDDGHPAIAGVDASFEPGELSVVCGENGAGKSTLLRAITGLIARDAGAVALADRPRPPATPDAPEVPIAPGAEAALAAGLCMVQQHLALVPIFSAIENAVLLARGGLVDRSAIEVLLQATLDRLGFVVPLDVPVGKLSVAERQRIEIARAVAAPELAGTKVPLRLLALDEPTAVLTPAEADGLYAVLRGIAEGGTAVVVVTHKLDEVRKFADHVLVLRRGKKVHDAPFVRADQDVAIDQVARAMLGDAHAHLAHTHRSSDRASLGGTPAVVAEGLALGALRRGTFAIYRGEVLGIAGVEGNGQGELVAILAGVARGWTGRVTPGPEAVTAIFPDRHAEGLVLDATVEDNLLLGSHRDFSGPLGLLDGDALAAEALRRAKKAGAPTTLDALASSFSGGNQQKIVVARALGKSAPTVLVAAHPTRGVDVAAAAAIHQELLRWVAATPDRCALVISADLDELRTLSNRIVVLAHGEISGEFTPDATDAELGAAMLSVEKHG